ncbi:UbiA family prenyltransferase [Thiocystis minor]|uniref:UbiA family prenyltransferase n=1 Tax=Thiocystis minor TaxID=61597 RepID=UPI0019144C53|nr:UbiA family prenyltransferase [Thiocystis minor]
MLHGMTNSIQSEGISMNTSTATPIVVDLDGTLTPTDTLVESLVRLVKQSPLNLPRLALWLFKGRAGFKSAVAAQVPPPRILPYHEPLLTYLREEKAKGRKIVLATAAHRSIADGVATHLDLFDQVLASDADLNLKGAAKLRAIRETVGESFVYAADSPADLQIWQAATAAILVNVAPRTADQVRRAVPIEHEFSPETIGLVVWLQALRVHQWLKNLLLFVPLLTAFSFTDISKLTSMVLAFLAFSFAASATYMVNDLWDLENDRAHPRKRLRPFASARLPILNGLAVAAGVLLLAFGLAFTVSTGFFLMLLLYLVLTTAYSWALKEYVLIDVLMLSLLYTLRILAGSVAVGIPASSWLLAFSVFMFLSLALVKRCAELVSLGEIGAAATLGRDYRVSDLVVLWPLGVGAALSAVVVFELFISAPETQSRYGTPQMLWLVAIGLIYWLARLWVKTSRGEMHDDPLVYAITDLGSRITVFGMIAVMLAAHFLTLGLSL